jgi:hypothetical protein
MLRPWVRSGTRSKEAIEGLTIQSKDPTNLQGAGLRVSRMMTVHRASIASLLEAEA